MNTGQVLFVIFAFILLSTLMVNFNRTAASSSDAAQYAQDAILLSTVTTSFEEIARGLAFDAKTDTGFITPATLATLTSPMMLGPDDSTEHNLRAMNDVDDFNGQVFEREIPGSGKRFSASFRVYYVDPLNIASAPGARTLAKRMEIRTWQSFPALQRSDAADTLKTSIVFGYFHFQ